jgi:putative ABC transport system substrate-binding protein
MGVSILAEEAEGKRQDILIEAVPGLRLMAVLADVNYASAAKIDELQKAARTHGIEFSVHLVTQGAEISTAIDSAQASGARALNTLASPLFWSNRRLIMERAASAHLPTIYEFPESAEEGALPPRAAPVNLGRGKRPTGRTALPGLQGRRYQRNAPRHWRPRNCGAGNLLR